MRISSRYISAIKENANVLGLATAASLSAATLSPIPLLVGIVAEAAYLLFVPDSKWYGARLAKRAEAENQKRWRELKDRVLPLLRPETQSRFARLEQMRQQLEATSDGQQLWFREVTGKLDYLLEKFLLFAGSEVRFRDHLRAVREELSGLPAHGGKPSAITGAPPPDRRRGTPQPRYATAPSPESWVRETVAVIEQSYDRELAVVEQSLAHEQDANTRAVLEKRLEVLRRRREFVAKIAQILVNLHHQLELVEDTFGLINDELRARSPEQILADIEDVVGQAETMTRVLEEVAPYEQMVARIGQQVNA
jgi:hypothetical protein